MKILENILKKRIVILDGGMGTLIQNYSLEEEDFRGDQFQKHHALVKGNNDLLSITQPKIIRDIHLEYLEAGADIIETNTFSGTSIAQADYGLQNYAFEMNKQSAILAKQACQIYTEKHPKNPKFVAGAIGPTNKTASMSPDVNNPAFRAITFDDLFKSYYEQAEGLLSGGCDMFLIETVFDTLNAKAAIYAINELEEHKNVKLPIMISGTITDASGRTLSGQTTDAFYISISHANPFSVGLNCALGANQLKQYLRILNKCASCFVSAYPNAGLPNEMGIYEETPIQMATQIEEYLQEGLVNIVGGCCGTTPVHIYEIAKISEKYPPRKLS